MADISITAASVIAGSNGTFTTGISGDTITAGQPVYVDTSDSNKVKRADANASAITPTVAGIALHASLPGQPIRYQTGGDITIGATLTVSETYVLSSTAGGICAIGDLASGHYLTYLGYGKTVSVMTLALNATGVQK